MKYLIALILAVALTICGVATVTATPQQAAKVKQLQAQVKRQQTAITARNKTIAALKRNTETKTEPCRSFDLTRPSAGIVDTCETRISALTSARDTLQAALLGSATDQINVMTPTQVWELMPTIYNRLGPPFTRSIFSGSGFRSYSFSN